MESVNIHEAKTRLSQLVAQAAKGEGFIIAKAGTPLVRVTAIDSPEQGQQRRTGFLAGWARKKSLTCLEVDVNLLLDTHVLLWAAAEPHRLSPLAATLINDDANRLYFNPASVWEVVKKNGLADRIYRLIRTC